MTVLQRSTSVRSLLIYRHRAQAAHLVLGIAEQLNPGAEDLLWMRRMAAFHTAVHQEYKEFLVEQGRMP